MDGQGFVVEFLMPSGWVQDDQLFFRQRDASLRAKRFVREAICRAYRIRRVTMCDIVEYKETADGEVSNAATN